MLTEPPALPVTTPVDGSTVAVAGVPELHVPPDGELASVIVEPTQTDPLPVMPDGAAGKPKTVKERVLAVEPQKLETV
jgi:hypothetical protein